MTSATYLWMFLLNFLGDWWGVASVKLIVQESYWALASSAVLSGVWWVSLFLFKDWDDFKKLAPAAVLGSFLGVAVGISL